MRKAHTSTVTKRVQLRTITAHLKLCPKGYSRPSKWVSAARRTTLARAVSPDHLCGFVLYRAFARSVSARARSWAGTGAFEQQGRVDHRRDAELVMLARLPDRRNAIAVPKRAAPVLVFDVRRQPLSFRTFALYARVDFCAPAMDERLYSVDALVSPYPLPPESVERRNSAPHRMPRERKQNHSLP
jgi:hypothetical protein